MEEVTRGEEASMAWLARCSYVTRAYFSVMSSDGHHGSIPWYDQTLLSIHHKRPTQTPFLYSSSLTAPCQTFFPSPTTKCPIKHPSPAPCQCVVPAGAQTTSPDLMRLGASPLSQIQPEPCDFQTLAFFVRVPVGARRRE